jgi:hypothetical protein
MTDSVYKLGKTFCAIVAHDLDHHGASKQDVLLALAVASAFVLKRKPHHVQDDLDDFISPAIQVLLEVPA